MMKEKINENIAALQEGIDLLAGIEDATFTKRVETVFNGTLGGHIRHNLDHYLNFLEGVETGEVDYESRQRDPYIERNRERAIECSREICSQLAAFARSGKDTRLRVRIEGPSRDDRTRWAQSSVSRELEFLLSHTIHHYALASVICRLMDVTPGSDFGVAPSTLRHRCSDSTCAR